MINLPSNNKLAFSVTNNLNNKAGDVEEYIDFNDLRDSFKVNLQLNSAYEISFTATYTNQYKYAIAVVHSKRGIWFNGQLYYVQQIEKKQDENGFLQLQVTATAMLIDRMKNVRLDPAQPTEDNPEVNSDDNSDDSSDDSNDDSSGADDQEQAPGTVTVKKTDEQQTYTLQNRLDQFLKDNDQGIKYELHGNFPELAVTCDGSLYDWLGSNLAAFGAYYVPDNYVLKIYDLSSLKHQTDHEFRYLSNMTNADIQSDATSMVNCCEVYGGKMEKDIAGSGGSDGSGGNLDSVEGFCKSPINADFGVNKSAMLQSFAARSQKVQARGVDVNRLYDVIKQNGVSPEWFFAYELQEQNSYMGWLNHFAYPHGDPYNDAKVVCDWIKQTAQTPTITAATESGKGNQSLAAQWNQEFPKGTIGHVYLQGTAAAAWELEGIAGGYYGKPLAGCVSVIKSWGGHTVKNVGNNGSWGWPFPSVGEGTFSEQQRFGNTSLPRGRGYFHDGVDFGSYDHPGAEVHAIHGGTVTQIAWGDGVDWYVVVTDSSGLNVEYQEAFSGRGNIRVSVGQNIRTGDVIGIRDLSHVHIGVTRMALPAAFAHWDVNDGTWLDPVALIKSGGAGAGHATKPSRANEFIEYCKSFVGKVPYVWGGASPSGWDCSGFVTYVLNHFGFNLGTHMTLGLSDLGQVVGPPYQTGDLLFWGPQGNWHHTSIAMDATYRVGADNYQDGTVYRTIASYPPTFGVRVPQLVQILGGTADSSGDDGSTSETYYALHYTYRDEESIKKYGLQRGAPVIMDSIYDMATLQKYVENTVQHDPKTTLTISNVTEKDFHLGDVWHLVAPELNLDLDVTLMGIEFNPYNPANDALVTFINAGLDMKNSIYAMWQNIKQLNHNVDNLDSYGTLGSRKEDHLKDIQTKPQTNNNSKKLSENEVAKIKAFTEGVSLDGTDNSTKTAK